MKTIYIGKAPDGGGLGPDGGLEEEDVYKSQTVYRELLKNYFPQLRRIRITVGYEARAFKIEEAASLIYTHPRLLSLQEMYRVAAFYRPGTEQYLSLIHIYKVLWQDSF